MDRRLPAGPALAFAAVLLAAGLLLCLAVVATAALRLLAGLLFDRRGRRVTSRPPG